MAGATILETQSSGSLPAKRPVTKKHIDEGLDAKTLPVLFREAAAVWGRRPAFARRAKNSGAEKNKTATWIPTGFDALYQEGAALATALIDLGIEAKDRVGMLADNRIEWIITNYGIQLAGAADVPRGADVTPGDVSYILPHSGATACFVEHLELWNRIKSVRAASAAARRRAARRRGRSGSARRAARAARTAPGVPPGRPGPRRCAGRPALDSDGFDPGRAGRHAAPERFNFSRPRFAGSR